MSSPRKAFKREERRKATFIYFGNEKVKVDAVAFIRNSQKFESLWNEQTEGIEFHEKVCRDAMLAYISACQDKEYVMTPDIAQDFLLLSRKWESPLLELVAINFCSKNNIFIPPKHDPLGILIEKLDQQSESVTDLIEVAKIIDQAFDDERLPDIEPEILFRIVAIAERDYCIDKNKLRKFVVSMFKTNPQSAVLMSMRIDFDELSQEELAMIMNCKYMREQSLSFFAINSISMIRNKCKIRCQEINAENLNMVDEMLRTMEYEEKNFIAEINQYKEQKKELIEKRLLQQKLEIDDIYQDLLTNATVLDGGILDENGLVDRKFTRTSHFAYAKIKEILQLEKEKLGQNKTAIHERLQTGVDRGIAHALKNDYTPESMSKCLKDRIEQIKYISQENDKGMEKIEQDLKNIQVSIKAKIVHDKLRCEKGRRKTDKKWSIFDDDPIQYSKADEFISSIERKIDEFCPIRNH